MVSELSTLIHNLVLDNPVPAKDLAKAIGKPYSTLLREVNPYDTGARGRDIAADYDADRRYEAFGIHGRQARLFAGCGQKRCSSRDAGSVPRAVCRNVRFQPCPG